MTQALTVQTPQSLEETMQLGDLLAKSGFFADSRGAAQAVVKVLAGREIGFGPIASMTGIHVIQGRVSLSANLMAAAVKRSGRYDYRVLTMSPDKCAIEFRERTPNGWDVIGTSEFTAADAKAAGTQNMAKFARNMLFARAMSNGARWFCPDIFGGPVYTPDELGAQVDGETGEVIDAPAPRIVVEQPKPATNGQQQPAAKPTQAPAATGEKLPARPWPPTLVVQQLRDLAAKTRYELPANGQWGALIGLLDSAPFGTQQRHMLLKEVFGVASSKQLTGQQRYALNVWAKPAKVGDQWCMDSHAMTEYSAIVNPSRISDDDLDGDTDPVTAGDFASDEPAF
jgi:hypothetical protein